jgi:hypothetical protein
MLFRAKKMLNKEPDVQVSDTTKMIVALKPGNKQLKNKIYNAQFSIFNF